jgi:hypothetical protein
MPHSLPAILAHVRAQGRPGSHQAVLVREIERLQAEVERLEADLVEMCDAYMSKIPVIGMKETTDV